MNIDPSTNEAQFYEINSFTEDKIEPGSFLIEYQTMLKYIHNSKSDIKTLFGKYSEKKC